MLAILHLLAVFVADLFKSRRRLEAENLFLRHQLNIALRRAPPRRRLHGSDRALLVGMDHADLAESAGLVPGGEAGNDPAACDMIAEMALAHRIPAAGSWLRNNQTELLVTYVAD